MSDIKSNQHQEDSESTISQKEAQVAELNESIENEKLLVQQLNLNISELQADILRFQNANKLFQYLKPSTIPEHTINSEDDTAMEFNEEHANILKDKRNLIPPLRAEVAQLEDEQANSEDRLTTLRNEFDNAQNQIVELQEKIRFANSECVRSTRELNYVQDQITERQNEIRMMEDLKREAQGALSSLLDRASDADGLGGGRLDTEKAIISLQNELRQVENEIAEIQDRIDEYKAVDEEDKAEKQKQKAAHDAAVNWQKEKVELQEEWRELMKEIQKKKNSLKTVETKQATQTYSTTRVIPLVKKWQGKKVPNANVPPEATIESMFAILDQVKAEHDSGMKKSEQEIAELIVNNAKLQEEVTRRRKALERTVTQFHADENAMRKKIDDIREKASKEEEKLLKQIESTKIKMAQRQLRSSATAPSTPKKP
ncbi:hypothetical protein TRFO_13484 [Tritrichomonas foetus]|uniref:Death domain-containing protein n=1 Tax=Tritrichomonas foetus TaxID=1144522 RepID=A0A1J4L2H9_9EUKA|nr:hypothetical protein TRFO_13484 [Tritrichomonas foetus]|eukprot:OHT16150.1 hypothetical protein TRFO_13484 [Tritrichomonas foetus]